MSESTCSLYQGSANELPLGHVSECEVRAGREAVAATLRSRSAENTLHNAAAQPPLPRDPRWPEAKRSYTAARGRRVGTVIRLSLEARMRRMVRYFVSSAPCTLYLAFGLGNTGWKLTMSTRVDQHH